MNTDLSAAADKKSVLSLPKYYPFDPCHPCANIFLFKMRCND
jgi:hypothetical protein